MFKGYIRNERGVSVILMALSIIVLFGFGALAIDVAHIYHVKSQLQVAADAAALAGANELGNPSDTTQTNARKTAFWIGLKNAAGTADINMSASTNPPSSYPTDSYGCSWPGCSAGDALPVVLNTDQAKDIQVGYYSGNNFSAGTTPVNAVMVIARRTGAYGYQPRVATWFAKIFRLLGARFDFTNVAATAVAAKDSLKLVPIMVNEYWMSASTHNGATPTGRPYSATVHDYPSSFVRSKEVAGWDTATNSPKAQTVDSPAFGYTFAIIGTNANGNITSNSPNGYADLNYRSDYYFGGPIGIDKKGNPAVTQEIYTAQDSSGDCSTNCGKYFSLPGSSYSDDSEKSKSGVDYLVDGYPANRLPPTAIYEILRATDPLYTVSTNTFESITSAYNTRYNLPTPAESGAGKTCPHAIVSFFSTSGKDPLGFNANKAAGKVSDYYPAGTRFMALVYDGTHTSGSLSLPKDIDSTQDKNLLTPCVGYVVIEVDGYDSGSPALHAGSDPATIAYNKSILNPSAPSSPSATMYGHAVSDIIQPAPSSPKGGCDFIDTLRQKLAVYNNIRLVRFSTEKYGVRTTTY